jgi:hypothetical protein
MRHNGKEGRRKLGTEAKGMRKERSADFGGRRIFCRRRIEFERKFGEFFF